MTEQEKQRVKDRVAALLDSNDRVRITDAKSLQDDTRRGDEFRRFATGAETYLLIAVGRETENERIATRLLSSIIIEKS